MHSGRIAALLVLLAATLLTAAAQAESFTFVALPDTQIYAENRFPGDGRNPPTTEPRGTGAIFYDQTEWIRDHADALGIRYVGHLGDIVQDGDDLGEWALARDAMDILIDLELPLGTVMGNHDDNHVGFYAQNYLDHFGPQVFQGQPWYVASSPNGGANFQLLEHGYYKIGFLNFSIDHPQQEIDWAQQIVMDNPDTIFIIGTHRYLFDLKIAAGRYGENLGALSFPADPIAAVPEPNDAEELFHEFVSAHPNILMIHAGHFHSEWLRLDGLNSAGRTILQILTDYQSTRNGGDGYLRVYDLDLESGTFRFDTYSPTLDRQRTTIDHYVETIYLGWAQRADVMDVLGTDEAGYLAFLEAIFGNGPAPDDFLLQHPDFDEPAERAYYQQYLTELFSNEPDVPEQFLDITHWEGLWLIGFARTPTDPFDFADWVRSPSRTLEVDFSGYFTPSLEQQLAMSFEKLSDALAALAPGDYVRPGARHQLPRWVERSRKLAEKGHTSLAEALLRASVLNRVDGCALRGEPDDGIWRDLIDNCEAQGSVYPAALAAVDLLDGL
jgi:hypothetical protein